MQLLPTFRGALIPCLFGIFLISSSQLAAGKTSVQKRLSQAADELLEAAKISYVYGGARIGEESECNECNNCLANKEPKPKERFKSCPSCTSCSLDCSHFIQEVYRAVGIRFPYLTTDTMRQTPKQVLRRRYGFLDLERQLPRVAPGDLLVYKGHVVMLEEFHGQGKGTIVHATGGRDIKGPGNGIQRERRVDLGNFRGPLQRILRHEKTYDLKLRKKRAGKG